MKLEEDEEMTPVKITTPTQLSLVDKVSFIRAVQDYPCLWDVFSKDFRDRTKKEYAWRELSSQFETDASKLHKCLKNQKENFKRCMEKRKMLSRNGVPDTALPRCQYFEDLSYLNHYKLSNPDLQYDCMPRCGTSDSLKTLVNQSVSRIEIPSSSTNHSVPVTNNPSQTSDLSSIPSSSTQSEQTFFHFSSPSEQARREKRKREEDDDDVSFADDSTSYNGKLMTSISSGDDEDTLWCWSLIPQLKALPLKKKRFAKIKISELLYNIEFDENA